ncbi:phosphonate ABC transporter, permease protein PhnE [Vineibacter terrae]|uniref:phosphonate ABC transporter, permease protein PhnE n=1 Tax=Vineibacter terrae TaxID=2586908 RepID=UPI002E347C87|nr:phosphonate ABC transporter, permease protein PhnE [Vineibacter terrae]HEX2889355.1 phosphonate ABC transporter, permease protein PhnE [Vineibacter terrae]
MSTTVDAMRRRYPDVFVPAWRRNRAMLAVLAGLVALLVYGLATLGFLHPRLIDGLGKLASVFVMMLPPDPGSAERAIIYLKALGETLAIAFLGTLLGAALAFPLGFLAARNATIGRVVRFLTRRSLDTLRGVDVLVWALIWINVVGLGPFAGVLALMTSDIGSFGKLFSEAIEAADKRPVEGVLSTGGGGLHRVRFGILPEVLPVMASQVLYFIESNTRSASIIGIVGAGGIGLHLAEQIRVLEFQHVAFIIILVLIAVAAIDWLSTRLRLGLIGTRRVTTA